MPYELVVVAFFLLDAFIVDAFIVDAFILLAC